MLLSVSPPLTLLPAHAAIVSNEIRLQLEGGSLPSTLPTPSALPRDGPRPPSAPPHFLPTPWLVPPAAHQSIFPTIHPSLYSTHSFLLDTALKAKDA